jgi:hypothetical protein
MPQRGQIMRLRQPSMLHPLAMKLSRTGTRVLLDASAPCLVFFRPACGPCATESGGFFGCVITDGESLLPAREVGVFCSRAESADWYLSPSPNPCFSRLSGLRSLLLSEGEKSRRVKQLPRSGSDFFNSDGVPSVVFFHGRI